eukprot:TRINITY_DN21046_c0_g1_i1.p1 TRINITY_DN21046_c0_g1~~TRINITY_DN21046_c0_g1_i1.p1  ORF type:complete len:598 (-),score=127.18 TRINITY_DN21046_c0_g1_i1:1375-3168(-)
MGFLLVDRVRHMLRDRWLGLVLGMWMQSCGGISYTFSLYSAAMKEQLGYNQGMTDGLGTAKDIGGNVGIVSGLLIDVLPPWTILLIGGGLHLGGYFMLYLASMGRVHPPFWQMCAFIMLGTNGATWFNTAVLVTCIRNFRGDRGVVVGLLKGFIGLSGAIFTQVYTAVYAPNTGPFLFLCAVVPPAMAVAACFVIRPIEEAAGPADDKDKARFSFLYVVGVGLAFYLMAVIVLQELSLDVKRVASYPFMLVMLLVLLLPARVPWNAAQLSSRPSGNYLAIPSGDSVVVEPREAGGGGSGSAAANPPLQALLGGKDIGGGMSASSPGGSSSSANLPTSASSGNIWPPETPGGKAGLRASPKLGGEHTLWQAVCTQDYWLLFFAMGCGTGSGLTAINNLGQMAEALGSKSVGAFVALVSVWNFLGRMGAGYVSEYYAKRYGTPRPLFMLAVQASMGGAHLLFASAVPQLLYVGSALVGLSHGAHWTLMVATASELFGLSHFGALYNTLSISATVGSYCLSVKLAGYIYDRQAAAEHARALLAGLVAAGSPPAHKCLGAPCFRPTFLIMAAVCGVGVLALARLVARTRRMYQELHKVQTM